MTCFSHYQCTKPCTHQFQPDIQLPTLCLILSRDIIFLINIWFLLDIFLKCKSTNPYKKIINLKSINPFPYLPAYMILLCAHSATNTTELSYYLHPEGNLHSCGDIVSVEGLEPPHTGAGEHPTHLHLLLAINPHYHVVSTRVR